MSRKKFKRQLQEWLATMDAGLDELRARMPVEDTAQLDFSIDSLDVLERWLLEEYPDPESIRKESERPVFALAGRYIGETFRENIGGHWSIEHRKAVYHGRPIINEYGQDDTPVCPQSLATAAIHRQQNTWLSTYMRQKIKGIIWDKWWAARTMAESQQVFSDWLAAMDQRLAWLLTQLPDDLAARLDYSLESLDPLERWLLERYPPGPETDAVLAPLRWFRYLDPVDVPPLLDALARYVGQTFCRNVGGRWWCDLQPNRFGVWGEIPLIFEFSHEPAPICPLAEIKIAIMERTGAYLASSMRSIRDEIPYIRKHFQKTDWPV